MGTWWSLVYFNFTMHRQYAVLTVQTDSSWGLKRPTRCKTAMEAGVSRCRCLNYFHQWLDKIRTRTRTSRVRDHTLLYRVMRLEN